MDRTLKYIQSLSRNLEHGVPWENICADFDNGENQTVEEAKKTAIAYALVHMEELRDGMAQTAKIILDIKILSYKKFNEKYN